MGVYAVKKGRNICYSVGLLGLGILLIVYSNAARLGVAEGLSLCGQVVIPALFTFMCLCEWVTLSGAAAFLTRTLRPLYRLLMGPAWQGGTALLLCLLGGYPMGAATLARLQEQDLLNQKQVLGLALLIFAPSPAFVITGVGAGMLGSVKAGFLLWGACTLATLLLTAVGSRLFVRFKEQSIPRVREEVSLGDSFVEAVAAACRKMLNICAMVVLFRVAGELLSLLPLSDFATNLLIASGEVTNGCAALGTESLPLMAAVISFGGICTHMQIKGILGACMPRYDGYLAVRLLHSAISYGITQLLCQLFPQALPAMTVGGTPVMGETSLLPSAALLVTCVVFLSSLNIGFEKRRKQDEKSGLY